MNLKELLYFELIDKLIDEPLQIKPGDVLRLHLDISFPIDNQKFKQIGKDLYKRAVERNQIRGSFLYPYYDDTEINLLKWHRERPTKTKRQKKLTLPDQEHH